MCRCIDAATYARSPTQGPRSVTLACQRLASHCACLARFSACCCKLRASMNRRWPRILPLGMHGEGHSFEAKVTVLRQNMQSCVKNLRVTLPIGTSRAPFREACTGRGASISSHDAQSVYVQNRSSETRTSALSSTLNNRERSLGITRTLILVLWLLPVHSHPCCLHPLLFFCRCYHNLSLLNGDGHLSSQPDDQEEDSGKTESEPGPADQAGFGCYAAPPVTCRRRFCGWRPGPWDLRFSCFPGRHLSPASGLSPKRHGNITRAHGSNGYENFGHRNQTIQKTRRQQSPTSLKSRCCLQKSATSCLLKW